MSVTRRNVLKGLVAAGTAATVGVKDAAARERKTLSPIDVGMLYDATRCIGCKACVVKCKEANGLPPEPGPVAGNVYDAPVDLSASTKTVIKLYSEGVLTSFVKAQCMHCVSPACVSVCMISAFYQSDYGIVAYDPNKCVGCRYCQLACPFNVPKYQWNTAFPKMVKCEMCRHLLAKGGIPACCEVCPRKAVIFGRVTDLLDDAKERVKQEPYRYYPKVYGESDAGGTKVLYLSSVGISFENLGLPSLGDEPVPELIESLQHAIYHGFMLPIALYGGLAYMLVSNGNKKPTDSEGEK
jgi:Fe-S-cluster-containing dehydrogenase component